jgi:hypothetical protein
VVIKEHPSPGVALVRSSAGISVVFSVAQGPIAEQGLYVHGPLRR